MMTVSLLQRFHCKTNAKQQSARSFVRTVEFKIALFQSKSDCSQRQLFPLREIDSEDMPNP